MKRTTMAAAIVGLIVITSTIEAEDRSVGVDGSQPLLLAPAVDADMQIARDSSQTGQAELEALYLPEAVSVPDRPTGPPDVPVSPSTMPPLPVDSPHLGPAPLTPVVLYPHVRVRTPHKAHPLGVPTVISVPDPRDHCGFVNVEVCMPPCPCLGVKTNRRGTRAQYDFGRYQIDIITRRGVVIIDYDS